MKIGLIVEGGGMKCAYSAGVLDGFLDEKISFPYCIGVSAGAANTASFLAGQRDRNRRFYTEHIHEDGYFGLKNYLKNRNLFGLRYIYGTLSNSDGGDPLDLKQIMVNPADFVIVATNAKTGKPEYFHKEELIQDDYRLIMASCCLPAACKPIEWKGQYYYDGGVSDSLPFKKAMEDGCDKVVAILSKPRDYVKEPEKARVFYTVECHRYPNTIHALNERHIRYNAQFSQLKHLEDAGKAFIFAPEGNIAMSTYGMDEAANQALYDQGLSHVQQYKDALSDFLCYT
ncbi:MAG: patatin family protein [Lachnospiraceae bacterium]|nr:patatin family protein [Lachnospiraceae bacterium]